MRSLQTVAALTCMKTLLMIFNILFWFSGIVLLILGLWLKVELHKYVEFGDGQQEISSSSIPLLFIGTGVFILFLSTTACCCTVKEQPILLYIYAAFLTIVFVVELSAIVCVYAYKETLSAAFENGLNSSLQVYNVEFSRTAAINSLQTHVHCCGVNNSDDWYGTKYGKVPGSCCKIDGDCDTNNPVLIYNTGCHVLLTNILQSNFGVVGMAAIALGFFQMLGIILTACLAYLIQKTKYEHMN